MRLAVLFEIEDDTNFFELDFGGSVHNMINIFDSLKEIFKNWENIY